MNKRVLTIAAVAAVCLAAALAVIAQRRQLSTLQAQKDQLAAQAAGPADRIEASSKEPSQASTELLELRNKITQLTQRKNELAGVRPENETLQAQLAGKINNSAAASAPSGFIRKADARWVGTAKPEDTFQSALWALHNRQIDTFLQLLEPGSAEKLRQQIGNSPEKFLDDAATIPAMRVSNLQNFGAATMKANLDLGPDDRTPRPIFFFLLNGQWKIVLDNPNARFIP